MNRAPTHTGSIPATSKCVFPLRYNVVVKKRNGASRDKNWKIFYLKQSQKIQELAKTSMVQGMGIKKDLQDSFGKVCATLLVVDQPQHGRGVDVRDVGVVEDLDHCVNVVQQDARAVVIAVETN